MLAQRVVWGYIRFKESRLTCLRLKNPFLSQLGRYKDSAITREVSFIPWMIPSSFLLHGPFREMQHGIINQTTTSCILRYTPQKNHMKLCTWNTYKFRLMLVNGQRRVINGWANDALLALLPLLLLAHCKDFFAVHNLFGIEWWWSNPAGTLCGSGVLVFSGLAICTTKNSNNRKRLLFFKLHFYAHPASATGILLS